MEAPETFWTLLHNAPHWEFELLVGFVEMLIFDLLIGAFLWPILKKRFKHQHCNECDCSSRVEALEKRVSQLMGERPVLINHDEVERRLDEALREEL